MFSVVGVHYSIRQKSAPGFPPPSYLPSHEAPMNHLTRLALFFFVLLGTRTLAATQALEEVTIYRDDFGTPHIFSETAEGVCFGHGYAQAEDRLEELLKQYLRCTGKMSAAFGAEFLHDDYRQRLWRHEEVARKKYSDIDPKSQRLIEAYQAGVKHFMVTHPSQVPSWAPTIEPWMVLALSRYILWGWPEGEAASDLERVGIKADPVDYRGSNQWLVAASRTADGCPLALIDPHLSWYGAFRFYEVRLYGGDIEFSGMSLIGMPLPVMGHNRYCSIAMTTGGPDTSDVYEEELNPANPRQYRFDNRWLEMEVQEAVIEVREGEKTVKKTVTMEYTQHGPVVAKKDGKAYVFAIPNFDQVGMADQSLKMITARNLQEMKNAIGMHQLMMQNLMIGTVDGDIYYVRSGRVPIRPAGYNHKMPVPGNTSKNNWLGIHPLEDLVQLHNPPQGYMQNCNVSPQFMMKDCPLKPNPDRPYLFNGFKSPSEAFDKPLHQRAASCLEQLHANSKMTLEDAVELALSPLVFGATEWQGVLERAWKKATPSQRENQQLERYYQLITTWNGRCDIDATGAIPYKYWKAAFGEEMKQWDRMGNLPPTDLKDEIVLQKLEEAMPKLLADYGRLDIAYGDVYRVGRAGSEEHWPVAGGSNDHIATPRAISFDPIPGSKLYLGRGGQTSTQIVQLSQPPKSWTLLPLGESDHKTSPHYDDQAEKLFGPGRMKPTYYLDKASLLEHVESKTVLRRAR